MPDLREDLAALRIDRHAERPPRRWIAWLVVLTVVCAAGFGVWTWITREQPIQVETVTVAERAAGGQAAVLNASGYVSSRTDS